MSPLSQSQTQAKLCQKIFKHTHTKIYLGLFSITVIGIEKEITLSITSSSLFAIRSENFDIINGSLVKQPLEWSVCLFVFVGYVMFVRRNVDSRLILWYKQNFFVIEAGLLNKKPMLGFQKLYCSNKLTLTLKNCPEMVFTGYLPTRKVNL